MSSNVFKSSLERLVQGKQEIEQLDGNGFIENAKKILASIQVTEILLVTFNSRKVYPTLGEEKQKDSTNFDEIAERAMRTLNLKNRPIVQVSIVAKGKNEDFEFQSELIFERIHRVCDAGILLGIFAIPRELTKKAEESQFDWISRLNSLLDDKDAVTKLNEKSEFLMERAIANHERLFRAIFDVGEIEKELKVDIGRMAIPQ